MCAEFQALKEFDAEIDGPEAKSDAEDENDDSSDASGAGDPPEEVDPGGGDPEPGLPGGGAFEVGPRYILDLLQDVHDAKEVVRRTPGFELAPPWSVQEAATPDAPARSCGYIKTVGESLQVVCKHAGHGACVLWLRHRGEHMCRAEAAAVKWLIAGSVASEQEHWRQASRLRQEFRALL